MTGDVFFFVNHKSHINYLSMRVYNDDEDTSSNDYFHSVFIIHI